MGKTSNELRLFSGSDLVSGKYRVEDFVVSSFCPTDGSLMPYNVPMSHNLQ